MSTKSVSTRRLFLRKASAALSAPLAVAAAGAAGAGGDEPAQARLSELEDLQAIRELHQSYAKRIKERAYDQARALFADPARAELDESIVGLSADGFGERDSIELAANGRAAKLRVHCIVESETAIGPTCTLVEMARQQGEGVVRRTERRLLQGVYVKRRGVWKIERTVFVSA